MRRCSAISAAAATAADTGIVDLGAMWIHEGSPGNPAYDLAQQLNITISRQQDYYSIAPYLFDGTTATVAEQAVGGWAAGKGFTSACLGGLQCMIWEPM